jgi:hypothetical protein
MPRLGCSVAGTKPLRAHTVRRVLALLAALAVMMLPVAVPAAMAAPDYPPAFYNISASAFSARVGQSIDFKAQTFKSGSPVSFRVTANGTTVASGSTQADAEGVARQSITFTVVGTNTVTMSGTSDLDAPLSLPATITVTADSTDDGGSGGSGNEGGSAAPADPASGVPFFGGGLPRTGGDIALTGLIALALIGGGAALVFATRNRRTS